MNVRARNERVQPHRPYCGGLGSAARYESRRPAQGVLFKVLQTHLETFLAAVDGGVGMPAFVHKELTAYLRCGVLAHGFARFRCNDCGHDRLVAFSCKGRGFCASCGGKRMTALAAELTDHVIPFVPVRQFALSVPHNLRYLLAYDHDRCVAVLRIFVRALFGFYRRTARRDGVCNGRTGSVTFVQRFGSAINLNLHYHVIVLDGVFSESLDHSLAFEPAEPPTEAELATPIATIRTRVLRYFQRRGLLDHDHRDADEFHDQSPLLANCYASSITGRQALGRGAGAKLERISAVIYEEGVALTDGTRHLVDAQALFLAGRIDALRRYADKVIAKF